MRTILPLLLALPTTAFAAPEPAERPVEVALRLEEPGGATRALALLVGSSPSTLDLREGDTKLFVRVGKADRPDGAVILEIELSRQTTSKGGERAFRVMTRHEVALGVPFEVARLADPTARRWSSRAPRDRCRRGRTEGSAAPGRDAPDVPRACSRISPRC